MEDNPMCRLSLSGSRSGELQPPMVPPCIPSIVDLLSDHDLPSSVSLSPFHPMPVCFNSLRGPGFFHYHVPSPPNPSAGGIDDESHHIRTFSDAPFCSMNSIYLPGSIDIPFTPSLVGFNQGMYGQPPVLAGHKKSQSDSTVGFSQENLQLSLAAPVKMEVTMIQEHQSRGMMVTTPDNLVDSNKGLILRGSPSNGSREQIEQENTPIGRTVNGSMPRHRRTSSMNSSFMTRNLDPGAGGSLTQGGRRSIGGSDTALVAANVSSGKFSEAETKTIMESEHLSELMLTDPKKVKRILNNRKSAARSKERKLKHKIALERKVQLLQMELTKFYEQLAVLQRECTELLAENNELEIRLQAVRRQAQISQAIYDATAAEGIRFAVLAGLINDPRQVPDVSHLQMSTQMIQQLLQPQPSQTQQNQPQESWKFWGDSL
ncbi:bZIP transcription factor 29-like [Oryza brachyantha]|uniref:bZIP transcription factor 29-like n=1 Tax=Oryza brachyantha TaxID=4533 RepID=UPI0007760A00|nr:bZIP transcription factor 29-like [Oryza brachyantha]